MTGVLQISTFTPTWLQWPQVQRMLGLFRARNVACCFIGGCIRNALVGNPPNDLDLLVDMPLTEITALLESEGITHKIIKTEWGAVRAYIDGIEFELLYAYGADVNESDSGRPFQDAIHIWLDYADFTINSLYLFPNGELHDPTGGKEDLARGLIRFAGDTEYRMRKDSGRSIIRFFRLYAWYGKDEPDAESLWLCVARASELLNVGRISIFDEMRKLLSAPKPQAALHLMHDNDVLRYAMGFPIQNLALIDVIGHIDDARGATSPWQARLVLLLLSAGVTPEEGLPHVAYFWMMNEAATKEISTLLEYMMVVHSEMPVSGIKNLAAQLGAPAAGNLLLIRWAMEDDIQAVAPRYLKLMAAIA